jgi:hypothetical protein
VLYSEPLFYIMTIPDNNLNADLNPLKGTHKQIMTENVSYVDGSARSTKVGVLARWGSDTLAAMGYFNPQSTEDAKFFLRRGPTWQTDAYPSPGSLFHGYNGTTMAGLTGFAGGNTGWPFQGFLDVRHTFE